MVALDILFGLGFVCSSEALEGNDVLIEYSGNSSFQKVLAGELRDAPENTRPLVHWLARVAVPL